MRLKLLEELALEVSGATGNNFDATMASVAKRMHFDYYAVAFDQWYHGSCETSFLAHSYPDSWAKFYVEFGLSECDPVRRAGENSFTGFTWRDMHRYIPMGRRDLKMLDAGQQYGVADGFTVPRCLPGQATAACTFAVGPRTRLPIEMLPVAEGVGAFALTTAKRLVGVTHSSPKPVLSDRQRDCVLLNARGLTAEQIGKTLGIAKGTVISHLRTARERYDVHSSEALLVCALVDRLFSLSDVTASPRRVFHFMR